MYRVEYRDLTDQVYTIVKRMILTGELTPGTKLGQDDLAERLGVSRTPLLSALAKLEKELLVESIPRRGMYVRKYSTEEVLHLYEIRLRLEPYAAGEAARRADDAAVERCRGLARRFRSAVEADEGDAREIDYEFHMAIMVESGNDLLYNIGSSYNMIVVANTFGFLKDARESADEHDELVEAIAAHRASRARQIMFRHINASRKNLKRAIAAEAARTTYSQHGVH